MPLIPAFTFSRQRQEDIYGFEASLVYRAISRTAEDTQGNPIPINQKNSICYQDIMLSKMIDNPSIYKQIKSSKKISIVQIVLNSKVC